MKWKLYGASGSRTQRSAYKDQGGGILALLIKAL